MSLLSNARPATLHVATIKLGWWDGLSISSVIVALLMSMLAENGYWEYCPVLSRKASAKGTYKGYIQWQVVGAQVLRIRDSLQVAPSTRNRPGWKQHHRLLGPDQNPQLDGKVKSCSEKEQVFPFLRDRLMRGLKSFSWDTGHSATPKALGGVSALLDDDGFCVTCQRPSSGCRVTSLVLCNHCLLFHCCLKAQVYFFLFFSCFKILPFLNLTRITQRMLKKYCSAPTVY